MGPKDPNEDDPLEGEEVDDNLRMMTMVGIITRSSTLMMGEMMPVMTMMGVGMMVVEGITFDRY